MANIQTTSKHLFLSMIFLVPQFFMTAAIAQSISQPNPHNLHGNSNSWQGNIHNRQNTTQNLQNRVINRQINPKNWRNSADNWKYKTKKFTSQIGIFDSDGKRFEYRDPREDKIVVKPYSNGGNKIKN